MAVAPTYAGNAVHNELNEVPGATRDIAVTGTVGAWDTYVTGGFAVAASSFGVSKINWIAPVVFSTGHYGIYVPSTGKIKVFTAGSGATDPAELGSGSTLLQSATFFLFGNGK